MNEKNLNEFIKWGSQNEENRKKAINGALYLIAVLNETSGKKLSDTDLKNIKGGFNKLFFNTFV
ncbi:MAG: hypothetical protein HZB76_06970 [Chlamydiae bacterium]|nr:hypothetical protein [Chlamydiota bacterium]